MANYSRVLLSGSINGLPIPVAATSIGSGTPVHTAVAGVSGFDEVYLYVSNVDSAAHTLTIGWGGTTDPADLICKQVSIPANSGPTPILTGQNIQNGLSIVASASVANVLNLTGHCNRIS